MARENCTIFRNFYSIFPENFFGTIRKKVDCEKTVLVFVSCFAPID